MVIWYSDDSSKTNFLQIFYTIFTRMFGLNYKHRVAVLIHVLHRGIKATASMPPWNASVEIYIFLIIGCPLPRRKYLGALCSYRQGGSALCPYRQGVYILLARAHIANILAQDAHMQLFFRELAAYEINIFRFFFPSRQFFGLIFVC